MKQTFAFILFLLFTLTAAEGAMVKRAQNISLGETEVRINVYENPGANITFFAPHYNEQVGISLAKEYIAKTGGRLVEIESYDDRGNPSRFVKFKSGGKTYTVDPNRIYTENGRNCNVASEIEQTVENFAKGLLQIILASDGQTLRSGERFIVAVHNNADVSAKPVNSQTSDLTAAAFIKAQSTGNLLHGIFSEQADGVFLSNTETDEDNFVLLSTPAHLGFFAERGFNVVVQKAAARLQSKLCTLDDGSFSVYAAQTSVPYICLEADGATGAARQRQMLEAVYLLLQPAQTQIESPVAAVRQ